MNDLKALYQEVILDHSKHPRHFYALEPCDHSATGHNPLCGDNLKVYVRMDGDQLADISFVGDGCAISKASASLMTDLARGKTVEEFSQLYRDARPHPGQRRQTQSTGGRARIPLARQMRDAGLAHPGRRPARPKRGKDRIKTS